MTSNAARSLNNVFKEARGLPICAIVEATYYKLLERFNKRREHTRNLHYTGQLFSERVTKILEKRAAHAALFDVNIIDVGLYEMVAKNERTGRTRRRDRSYKVILAESSWPKYKCRKPQNTGITCKHVIAACAARNFDPNQFTHQYYRVNALVCTWKCTFEIFGREEDLPEYNGDRIISNRTLVKKVKESQSTYP
jgi:hypothetical protein